MSQNWTFCGRRMGIKRDCHPPRFGGMEHVLMAAETVHRLRIVA
jgi:hypothetical protein